MAQKDYAVVITAYEKAELISEERDPGPLHANEVAGRTLATLISAGTEIASAYRADKFPRRPGYSAVFEVERTGADVADIRPGDRVFCMGRHQSYQRTLRQEVIPVPDGLPAEQAVFARMMGVTMSTLTTTTARPPAQIMVTGLGLVGHLAAQTFASCGYRVAAVDPVESRRAIAIENGIAPVFATVPLDDPAYVDQIDLVLECAGHEQAAIDAARIVRKRGEVVLVGTPWRRYTEAYAHELTRLIFHRYVVMRSGWEWELPLHPEEFRKNSLYGNFEGALRWLAEGRVRVKDLYTKVPPREAQTAYQDLVHKRTPRLAIVFDWEDCP